VGEGVWASMCQCGNPANVFLGGRQGGRFLVAKLEPRLVLYASKGKIVGVV